MGTANGMARYRDDIRCVIEAAQFADYVWPAMEQIVEMSHEYWRTKGQFSPNVTMRLSSGGYIGGGLYHSQNTESHFRTFAGCANCGSRPLQTMPQVFCGRVFARRA